MSQASTARGSAYLTALTQEIEKKLQRALVTQSQRLNLMQELFADVALEVDVRARDIILSKDEDGISSAEGDIENHLCFYDVLADHYVKVPENGKPILDLIVQLWSQSFASNIFALLFHKWTTWLEVELGRGRVKCIVIQATLMQLFEVQLENSEILLRYSSALVQGATNVFWIDIQTNRRCFLSLFHYLLEEVALVPMRLNKIALQAQRDLYLVLSRFMFFYNLVNKLEALLNQFPIFPNAFLVGGPADIFVIELTDQLQKLKVEPVLLHYLSHMKVLQDRKIPTASYKSVFSTSLPVVLALFMLEFCSVLYQSNTVLTPEDAFFKLEEYEKTKRHLNVGSLIVFQSSVHVGWNSIQGPTYAFSLYQLCLVSSTPFPAMNVL
ncbi:PREDICTED: uncharacterized protein LOC104594588 isoform X1 [Nelumbo nucifera]|uniref:Uncharacterized protein LOC104594588 isoform X1 n=1 Tax=Nelumbo nucifera TaxID=4432 RepID=A0A1U8Q2N5_NELNU|nr:PREDICTED: uncharacterized protein LOC104594588 isoform X1 [Nelumbo nucifera]